jgi:hypothetical protein
MGQHSKVEAFAISGYPFIGGPDFVFQDDNGFVTAVMELKTFWYVTKEQIDEVLNGTNAHLDIADLAKETTRKSPVTSVAWRLNKHTGTLFETPGNSEFLQLPMVGASCTVKTTASCL